MAMPNATRHLAAIMFTDIVGYTSLMGSDEHKAMSVLKANREIHKRIIQKHRGTWLKEMGDGTLAKFQSVSDAVYCAGELIKLCNEKGIALRIGIHSGDVIEEDGDIFGDGVNVASRLEPLAAPNQIMVSGPIHRNIKNKSGIRSTFVEELELKNVDEPIKVYSVEVTEIPDEIEQTEFIALTKQTKPLLSKQLLVGLFSVLIVIMGISYFFNPLGMKGSLSNDLWTGNIYKSIAVLPFRDMSPDRDQEYLGDGIAEDIINKLTRVEGLKVIGRTSSFSFKTKETDLKTIGKMLDVETILEGSVQKSGSKLRITAQLINAKDGYHIWSESYNREFSDVFSIQDELAHLVVAKMLDVPGNEGEIIYTDEIVNSEAYEYFLKGKHIHHTKYVFSGRDEDFLNAELYLKKALELSPDFGMGLAGLADLYNTFTNQNSYSIGDSTVYLVDSLKIHEYIDLQRDLSQRALQLNPNSDYVNEVRGWVYLLGLNYDSAFYLFANAVKINPKNESNLSAIAYFYSDIGLYEEASVILNKAKKINPIDYSTIMSSANTNFQLRKLNEALSDYQNIILFELDTVYSYVMLMDIYILQNDIENAEQSFVIFEKNAKDNVSENTINNWKSIYYAIKGDTSAALKNIDNIPSWTYSILGMKKKYLLAFFEQYNTLISPLRTYYIHIINLPEMVWIKDDPRIQELIRKEKEKYDILKAKYGNLDFLNL